MTFLAPCGHLGVPIIGTYISCLSCDGKVKVTSTTHKTVMHQGNKWNVVQVLAQQKCPSEGTHVWCVSSNDSGISGYSVMMLLNEIIFHLEKYQPWVDRVGGPGWEVKWGRDVGRIDDNGMFMTTFDYIVFWRSE